MSYRKHKKCRSTGKIIYKTEEDAGASAEYLVAIDYRPELRLFVYRCPHCRHFHLTKRSQGPKDRPELTEGKDVR